jgi:cell division protein FtsN
MKKIAILVFTLLLALVFTSAEAQSLSRKEKKEIKKEIKSYKKDPDKWVKMKDRQKRQIDDLTAEAEDLKRQLAAANLINQDCANKLLTLQNEYGMLKKSMPSTKVPDGTVYQVQMGYYKYLDLVSFNAKLKIIKAEEIDGAKRYVIGYFENSMDAMQFSNDLKTLGIKDAFVSQYVNGVRNMKFDALKSISK